MNIINSHCSFKNYNIYLQWILTDILLDTDGGTPFDAMQKYEPISFRDTFVNFKTSPRYDATVDGLVNIYMCVIVLARPKRVFFNFKCRMLLQKNTHKRRFYF